MCNTDDPGFVFVFVFCFVFFLPSARSLRWFSYTNTETFTLLCKQCGDKLVGEKGVAEHSMQTGHSVSLLVAVDSVFFASTGAFSREFRAAL